MENYKEYSDNIDTIPIGHRVGIKTKTSFINDLFFEEYVEPIIVVKKDKKNKKYDISNASLYIYHIDETKEFINNVKKMVDDDNIIINSGKGVKLSEVYVENDVDIIRSVMDNILKKIEIIEIVNRFKR